MQNLFSAQLMAGTNCWDVHGHVMSGSNDIAMRKKIFAWIEQHDTTFYNPRTPIHPIGVYFSPRTRDYFAEDFLDSYFGTMALLMHSHREFQIVTPRTLADFHGPILALPDARCLSDAEIKDLESYARRGGKLIVSGRAGRFDEGGKIRAANPLHQFLGIRNRAERPSGATGGGYVFLPQCPGRAYWLTLGKEFSQAAARGITSGQSFQALRREFDANVIGPLKVNLPVEINASPFVTAQVARADGKTHVFLANFKGLQPRHEATQIPEKNVEVVFPPDSGSRAFILPFLGKVQSLPVDRRGGQLRVIVPAIDKGAVVWVE